MGKGMFKKMADASMTGGGNYIKDGNYELLVESCSAEDKRSGECFIMELRVTKSTPNGELEINPKDPKSTTDRPVIPAKPGTTISLVCNMTKFENAAGNAKAAVFGVLAGLGYTEDQITEQTMVDVCGPKQPLRGLAVAMETYRTVNKGKSQIANAGNILVLPKWSPIAQTKGMIAAQRALLSSKPAEKTEQTEGAAPTTPPVDLDQLLA